MQPRPAGTCKSGGCFRFKFMEKISPTRYTGKIKAFGHKSYVEKCLTLSQACKEHSGEPDLEFLFHCTPSPSTSQMVEAVDVVEVPSEVSFC